MKIFLSFRVESGLCRMNYELAEHPLAQLIVCALLSLAERDAQRLKLSFVERVGQIVEQILRTTSASLANAALVLTEHVGKDLYLRPDVVVDEPFDEAAHGLCPRLVVERPEQASGFPCRHESTLGNVPQNVVVGKVGKRSHVCSELVDKAVERLDYEATLADGKSGEVFVETLVEVVAIFALAGYASVATLAWLVGEDHASEGAVEELVLVELACGEGR